MATSEKPLRRDAARNRERILAAAEELFAARGLAATLNDVAHHAGVGVGTVYRHFPNKTELIETLFQARIDDMVAIAEAGLADPDPWQGLVTSMRRGLELQASDRGLHDLVNETPTNFERIVHVRSRMLPVVSELVRRAQDAGAVRPDLEATDLIVTHMMIGAVLDASRATAPELWRRYLDLLLAAMATHPETLGPLGAPALTDAELDPVMSAHKLAQR